MPKKGLLIIIFILISYSWIKGTEKKIENINQYEILLGATFSGGSGLINIEYQYENVHYQFLSVYYEINLLFNFTYIYYFNHYTGIGFTHQFGINFDYAMTLSMLQNLNIVLKAGNGKDFFLLENGLLLNLIPSFYGAGVYSFIGYEGRFKSRDSFDFAIGFINETMFKNQNNYYLTFGLECRFRYSYMNQKTK